MTGGFETPSGTKGEAFWEEHYAARPGATSGRPSAALVRFCESRTPGRALDLGCAKGDDVLWLAGRGWKATGVDVSATVIEHARANAVQSGFADRAAFEQHDLSLSMPAGPFDLVSAMFLHSPVELSRADILRRAAALVAPGGLLLSVSHASSPPWSWTSPGTVWPTAEEELDAIGLDTAKWRPLVVRAEDRESTGPDGAKAVVTDNVIALERLTR